MATLFVVWYHDEMGSNWGTNEIAAVCTDRAKAEEIATRYKGRVHEVPADIDLIRQALTTSP